MQNRIFLIAAAHIALAATAHAQRPEVAPNAPADKPISVADCQWRAIQQAAVPYVAQARASYPDARRKFSDRSKPERPMFITTLLTDSLAHHEQVFVRVDSIVDTRIFGRIASQIGLVRGYRVRQPLVVDEKNLMDWMFANPDGSEEGNIVGKFMDSFAMPTSCGS